jgi:RimJ/RimL family protein N-acetyltransferase
VLRDDPRAWASVRAVKVEPPDPPLADDRILLRGLRDADVRAVAAACRDGEIVRWTTQIPLDYTEENASQWIASTHDGWASGTADFAVVEHEGRFVGAIGLVVREPWLGEIGYWTAAAQRGRGYTTRALKLVTTWGYALGLTRLQLTILVGNTASERVAAKAGYRREGTLRSYANQRGELRDVTLWARLADDPER